MAHRPLSLRLPAVFSVICAFTLLAIGHVAPQQVPQIGEVPDSLPEARRTPLRAVYTKLVAMRDTLGARLAEHDTRCRSVKVGSAEEQLCKQNQSQLISEREQYIRAVNNFNDILRGLAGENLSADTTKWEQAIKAGQLQAAIDKALAAAVQQGKMTEPEAARLKTFLAAPAFTVESKDGRAFLAQGVTVPGRDPPLQTFKYAPLTDGETVDTAAQNLIRIILSDRTFVAELQNPTAPAR